jgi:hypothetical protein
MDLHLVEFLGRETAGLRNDVFGHGELPDIVQERRGFHGSDFGFGELKLFCHFHGVNLDAL